MSTTLPYMSFSDKMKGGGKADNTAKIRRFFVFSTFGEIADVAYQLQDEGEEVVLYVSDNDYKSIGNNMIEKADNWHEYVGKNYVWVVDGCEHANLQDWLRERGEWVVGTNEALSAYENDRQLGQSLFKAAGFNQPESHNFKGSTAFDDAIAFIKANT